MLGERFGTGTSLVDVATDGVPGTVNFDPAAQTLTYTADHPWLDTLAPDNFPPEIGLRYTVVDGNGVTHTGRISVGVNGVNDDPVALDDQASVAAGGSVDLWDAVLANDSDVDGPLPSIVEVNGDAAIGSITFDANGTIVYQAADAAACAQTDSFTYTIQDSSGARSTATVEIDIVAAAPAAFDAAESMPADFMAIQMDQAVFF